MITIERYHDFSCGHRVAGHESKCRHLHGHNYRITFTCSAQRLDALGRVVDFSIVKYRLCNWLEEHWDHKFLLWINDPMLAVIKQACWTKPGESYEEERVMMAESIVPTPFNPTAENMADYLLTIVGPQRLRGTGVHLIAVKVEETRKCSASAMLGNVPDEAWPVEAPEGG